MHSQRKIETLATAVHEFCRWWDIQVRSVLDVGAGVGYWSGWYRKNHVPTKTDLRHNVDRAVTDFEIFARSGLWYRNELKKYFHQAGAGLWVAKTSTIMLYELEGAPS